MVRFVEHGSIAMAALINVTKDVTRVCGEAKIVALHDGERIVEAYFVATAPVRGFEKLVLGKNPIFVLEAVMRICGICHAAHGIAASEAFEDALGIAPPANGRLLRESIGLINRVQSHLLHLTLIIPDIVPRESELRKVLLEAIKAFNMANDVMMRIGGASTHPPNIVIGGVARMPPESSIRESMRILDELRKTFASLKEELAALELSEGLELLRTVRRSDDVKFLASHIFYGDRFNIEVDKVEVLRYEEYRKRFEKPNQIASTSLVALYKGSIVETGPRARLSIYRGFDDSTLLGVQLARLEDVELSIDRVKELLSQVDTNSPTRTGSVVFRRGRGVGVYEAPRGTLIHFVELDDNGRVRFYKIVVPTMFNIPVIEKYMVGIPVEAADLVPRLYDPCIPCSTHLIEVRR